MELFENADLTKVICAYVKIFSVSGEPFLTLSRPGFFSLLGPGWGIPPSITSQV